MLGPWEGGCWNLAGSKAWGPPLPSPVLGTEAPARQHSLCLKLEDVPHPDASSSLFPKGH